MQTQPVKGTRDLLFDECDLYTRVVDVARQAAELYGYRGIELPIFEYTEVFARTLGETSDVVNKEMYTFTDKGDRSLTLRPEFTAGITRSIISNNLQQKLPLRLFTHGPLFRYERPQKGRYRQFSQINFENIGVKSPAADAEMIALARTIIDSLGIQHCSLELNSLGALESRGKYIEALCAYLAKYEASLSPDSQVRLKKNPLRILDSKDSNDQAILRDAPALHDYLTSDSRSFFDALLANLDNLGIHYAINNKIVRGLDYYTDTVFEFVTTQLGTQGSVIAGGRYDGLLKLMGGPDVPAIGFGGGIDRLMMLCQQSDAAAAARTAPVVVLSLLSKLAPAEQMRGAHGAENPTCTLLVHEDSSTGATKQVPVGVEFGKKAIALGQEQSACALNVAQSLRAASIATTLEESRDIGKSLRKASENQVRFVVLVGGDEVARGVVKLKNLDARKETEVPMAEIVNELKKYVIRS